MRQIFGAAVFFSLVAIGTSAAAEAGHSKMRLADAAADACFAKCENTNASCKRVCPVTFSTPCLNSCDSQAQTCRQSCQQNR
jgi:hypothetical protein